MSDPPLPLLPPQTSEVKVVQKEFRPHSQSLRDTVIGTVVLGVAVWYIHLRHDKESFPTIHDVAIILAVLLVGLAVGYRDRLPMLTRSATKVIRARRDEGDDRDRQ